MSRKEKQLICNIVDLALQCVQPNPARQISLQALHEGLANISSGTYQESETTSESYSYSDISSSVDPTQFDQQETEGTEIIDHSNTGSSQTFMIKRKDGKIY